MAFWRWSLEEASSGRSTCKTCYNTILKGDLRLKEFVGNRFGHAEFRFHHAKCGRKHLIVEIEELDKIIDKIEKVFGRPGE